MINKKNNTITLIAIIFFFLSRLFFGLSINFNHEDIKQIYLIGLKYVTSGIWPFWGPDIVWNASRIPGALQGLLIGLPLKVTNLPYAPIIFVNILNSFALLLLTWYAGKRFSQVPIWLFYFWLLILPWTLYCGTTTLNTSYLIFSSVLFFISLFDLFLYDKPIINKNVSYFLIGFSILWSFQLHMGWLLLLPYITVLLFIDFNKNSIQQKVAKVCFLTLGGLAIGSLIYPTLNQYGLNSTGGVENNITFNTKNLTKIFDIFFRLTSIASFEIKAFNFINDQAFKTLPALTYIRNIIQIPYLIFIIFLFANLFIKKPIEGWNKMKLLYILSLLLTYISYLFTEKYIETRTFIILAPIPIWYSFYCFDLLLKNTYTIKITKGVLAFVGLTFFAIAITSFNSPFSIKKNYTSIKKVLETGNTTHFGYRRISLFEEQKRESNWIKKEVKKGLELTNNFSFDETEIKPDNASSEYPGCIKINNDNYYLGLSFTQKIEVPIDYISVKVQIKNSYKSYKNLSCHLVFINDTNLTNHIYTTRLSFINDPVVPYVYNTLTTIDSLSFDNNNYSPQLQEFELISKKTDPNNTNKNLQIFLQNKGKEPLIIDKMIVRFNYKTKNKTENP